MLRSMILIIVLFAVFSTSAHAQDTREMPAEFSWDYTQIIGPGETAGEWIVESELRPDAGTFSDTGIFVFNQDENTLSPLVDEFLIDEYNGVLINEGLLFVHEEMVGPLSFSGEPFRKPSIYLYRFGTKTTTELVKLPKQTERRQIKNLTLNWDWQIVTLRIGYNLFICKIGETCRARKDLFSVPSSGWHTDGGGTAISSGFTAFPLSDHNLLFFQSFKVMKYANPNDFFTRWCTGDTNSEELFSREDCDEDIDGFMLRSIYVKDSIFHLTFEKENFLYLIEMPTFNVGKMEYILQNMDISYDLSFRDEDEPQVTILDQ